MTAWWLMKAIVQVAVLLAVCSAQQTLVVSSDIWGQPAALDTILEQASTAVEPVTVIFKGMGKAPFTPFPLTVCTDITTLSDAPALVIGSKIKINAEVCCVHRDVGLIEIRVSRWWQPTR